MSKMEEHLRQLQDLSATCLFVGWGKALERGVTTISEASLSRTINPDILQHMFRYIQCNKDCTYDERTCIVCSRHHGEKLAITRHGDSGSPLICDGFVTAVHSRGIGAAGWFSRNYTIARHTAVACVKDFISETQLSYLRSVSPKHYHYINGQPVLTP
uniref:Kallikrein 1-related peptidase b16 n=1 Tax=Lygus hesperus TaxID=30085 RepID=A0A0A9YZ85_LYGHE